MFEDDVIRHAQEFLARRRAMRPQEGYRPVTEQEWYEFEERFDKRKVELGSCGRARTGQIVNMSMRVCGVLSCM